jgi:hypothetical protein
MRMGFDIPWVGGQKSISRGFENTIWHWYNDLCSLIKFINKYMITTDGLSTKRIKSLHPTMPTRLSTSRTQSIFLGLLYICKYLIKITRIGMLTFQSITPSTTNTTKAPITLPTMTQRLIASDVSWILV